MTANLLGTSVEDILGEVFDDEPDELFVVNPSADAIESFVDAATHFEGPLPETRLLADDRLLKDVMDDFLVASNTADLIENDVLTLRTADDLSRSSLLVTDDRVVALVTAGDQTAGLVTDDAEFVPVALGAVEGDWDDAEEYTLRTPAISRVRQTLDEEISPEVEGDFDDVMASMETARGDGDGLDEVTVSLLVAAKNRVLLYDISKWGEDVGIASKATFSRTKTKLEDMGLIDTEKVPIDVGRPRLRLKLADDRLQDAPPSELANVAQTILR
ncbi:transcriptional regulator TbsP [Halarchaeum sp. P4]|uniref:transcriptional regulator TbsP n=1 Tax=Halarchaeum sp. P4 TaxID=3421639 RepID=UPI003EBC68A9